MENTKVFVNKETTGVGTGLNRIISLIWLVFIAGIGFLIIYRLEPPKAVRADAPLTEFSSGRAMSHLRAIAQRPHPIGSMENAEVRDYIRREFSKLGIQAEVQSTTSVNHRYLTAGMIHNIVGRLKGTGEGKAIMLAGHYDSVMSSPGASDDGVAVAALLETARALKANPPLRNDVIFLITDGEEVGLLGAKAFIAEHPWVKDVGVVFNFEARGSSGPAVMFETSEQNGRLVEEFTRASTHPVATSLAYEVYKRLPNDTDLSVFKQGGMPSLNFAHFYGLSDYHTSLDNLQRVNERSMQHHGLNALALARHFGDLNIRDLKDNNAVYFDVLALLMIHYGVRWVLLITSLLVLMFVFLLWYGVGHHYFTLREVGIGALAYLALLIAVPLSVTVIWRISKIARNIVQIPDRVDLYNSSYYLIAVVALTIAVFMALLIPIQKKNLEKALTVGAFNVWLILLIISTIVFPSGSYFFAWPLLFSLLASFYLFAIEKVSDKTGNETKRMIVHFISSIPALLLVIPVIYLISQTLVLQSIVIISILMTLLLGLLFPLLSRITISGKKLLPIVFAVVGVILILAGSFRFQPSIERPKSNSIFYAMSVDSGKAIWGSADSKLDEWTSQYIKEGTNRNSIGEYIPHRHNRFLNASAPVLPLAAPEVQLIEDRKGEGGARILRFRVTSLRKAPIVRLILESNTKVLRSTINGKHYTDSLNKPLSDRWEINYFGLPHEGIEFTLELAASEKIKLRVIDQSYGLPVVVGKTFQPRPDYFIAASFALNDSTLISRSYFY